MLFRSVDIIAVAQMEGMVCVNLAMVRGGRHLGDRAYFPKGLRTASGELPPPSEILEAFIAQHYLEDAVHDGAGVSLIPPVFVLNHPLQTTGDDVRQSSDDLPEDLHVLLNAQAGKKITFLHQPQGQRRHWLAMAEGNAKIALTKRLVETGGQLRSEEHTSELQSH